jgi:hypothetical protein
MARPELPVFPAAHFTNDQLEALRDLTCYATGLRPYRELFPQDAEDGLIRPSDGDVSRFKQGPTKLDYGGDAPKIRAIYTRVFNFLVVDFTRHRNLLPLFNRVYPQKGASRLPGAAAFFYDYFAVNQLQMPDIMTALEGVHALYRNGEVTTPGQDEEFVKSILGVWGRNDGKIQWLEFKLAYKAGRKGDDGRVQHIRGVVVPVNLWIYFLGVDEGMGRNPSMMISMLPNLASAPRRIPGILLRLNTLHIISAARTVLLPIPRSEPHMSIDALFAEKEKEAEIYSRSDPIFDAEFRPVLDEIDNKIDGVKKRTLRI